MLIKNKIFLIIVICLFYLNVLPVYLFADEFNISATEVSIDQKNNIVIGEGSVEVTDVAGNLIKSDKATYKKTKEFLMAEGSVEVFDTDGNILKTDKATYDNIKNLIITYDNSELILKEGHKLTSSKILYNIKNKILSSDQDSIFADIDGNIVMVDMFQYQIEKNLFSSIGKIKIIDVKKNKYFFKEIHVDTKKNEMIGSDVSVALDNKSFGVSEENDPRFAANDILITNNKSKLSKGVFTVCKQKEGKCLPWTIQANKILHDNIKKKIYYEHATLKIYDVPIFYFPRFSHPDPSVKRQSGFLTPFFTESTNVGAGFGLPYFWAISHDKDLTFTPKVYAKENVLLLNEYRQAYKNAFLTLDTSYTQGYKDTNNTKTDGSRNHIFSELNIDLGKNKTFDSNLSFKMQKTSNDTYFRVHDINTTLVDSENTNLENKINYNFNKEDMYLNISATVYENLREKSNDRYEYILPNILFGKNFLSEKFGSFDLKSNALYKNYDGNKYITSLTNDVTWSAGSKITQNGFVNILEGMVKNTNYNAKNTPDYKTNKTTNELSGVLTFKSSLPMEKKGMNFSKTFSPNVMFRYAPGHMRDLSGDDVTLNYANLYSMNKTSEIEDGLSAVIGFDYKSSKKSKKGETDKDKFSVSMGQVFRSKRNENIPSRSSLDQKMSDMVGEINYNFSKIGNINYKYSLDHNFNTLNYNNVSTSLNFGKIGFNLDYLEERNHVGKEHYLGHGIDLNINDHNKFSFSTKKNYKTDSTEFYDISYQYAIDCLTAGLVFKREFYDDTDSDLEPKDSLMFTISFIPLGGVKTPSFISP
jgi:LPS-assembly protein